MGPAGRDGRDLVATDAVLADLHDVALGSRLPLAKGQVLTFNGVEWEHLFVPQLQSITAGGGGSDLTVVSGQQGSSISWIYHEETGEPHERKFHTHGETDATLITELHVSKTNAANNDVELLLDALLPITSQLYISDSRDPSQAHLYNLTSYVETTDGFNLTVEHVETPGPEPNFVANDRYDFLFLTAGGTGGGGGATSIDELTDVDTSTTVPEVGQTLVWDGTNWVPGDSSEGIGDAPIDGNYYVRSNGQWVNLVEALNYLMIGDGGMFGPFGDGGNFTTGYAGTAYTGQLDGSDLTADTTDAAVDDIYDGGEWS